MVLLSYKLIMAFIIPANLSGAEYPTVSFLLSLSSFINMVWSLRILTQVPVFSGVFGYALLSKDDDHASPDFR